MMNSYMLRVGVLKGWLMAKDAPKNILDIIEELSEEAPGAFPSNDEEKRGMPSSKAKAIVAELAAANITPPIIRTDMDHLLDDKPKVEISMISEKKPRKPWSPESRAAAGERMKARQAANRANNEPDIQAELNNAPRVELYKKPRKDTPVFKLIYDHVDYAGVREDYTLVPSDWGDIQKMRYNGLPDERIAKSYGIGKDYLMRFIAEQEKAEERKTGNF